MRQQENTPQLWDNFWRRHTSCQFQEMLETERLSIRWKRLRRIITDTLGPFSCLNVIEIGAGAGSYSALAAELGASVSILDYSSQAIEASRNLFSKNGISASYVCCDALHLPQSLKNRFDISMSFGLAEHFKGEKRNQILNAHLELIRPRGIAIVSVPNAWNPPYRLWKWWDERRGRWPVGEEYPFTRNELLGHCRSMGWQEREIIGDSLLSSFKLAYFLRPTRLLSKLLGRPLGLTPRTVRRLEKGTPLDAYFSYALVLCVKKGP